MAVLRCRVSCLSRLVDDGLSRLEAVDALRAQRGAVPTLAHDADALAHPQGGEGVDGCRVLIPRLPRPPARAAMEVGGNAGDDGQFALPGGEDEAGPADRR